MQHAELNNKETFSTFPRLETERLVLRKIEIKDSESILFLRSNASVIQYIERPEDRKTKTLSDAINFISELDGWFNNKQSITWGITLKNDSHLLGTICLWNFSKDFQSAEVGYDLRPEVQGKGIMNEALNHILDYGFTYLELSKIVALTHRENQPSKKLLLRNGFSYLEKDVDLSNKDNIIFELIK